MHICDNFLRYTKINKGWRPELIMPFKDPEMRRNYRRKWYGQNKVSEKNHVKRRKDLIKYWFEEFKKNLSCSKCGESHPAIIDFHHKKENEKENNISFMVVNGYSIDAIKDEIRKCSVLCANCHRKIHYKYSNL